MASVMARRFFPQSHPTYQLTASIMMPSIPVSIQKRTTFSISSTSSGLPQLNWGSRTFLPARSTPSHFVQ